MKIGDIVEITGDYLDYESPGVGIILEVLNRGYARKASSALVYWSGKGITTHHPERVLKVLSG